MLKKDISRNELLKAFHDVLQPNNFKDYGPNGLQVEGRERISHIVSGVTASRALIDAAIEAKADAIFVHHGLFWRGQDGTVTGWMKQRLQRLLQHDINLIAYHLPLDAHPELGNNAQLAKLWGLNVVSRFGDQNLGLLGQRTDGQAFKSAQDLASAIAKALGRTPQLLAKKTNPCKKLPGVQAVHKAISKMRLPLALTLSSRAKSLNPKRIWRVKQVLPFWPVATMRRSVMVRLRWQAMWRKCWGLRTSSSTSTILLERLNSPDYARR